MTISVIDTKETFLGDGSLTDYTFSFKVDNTADVVVRLVAADGVETVLVEGEDGDYTVVLNINQNTNPGGTVTFKAAPGEGVAFIIMRGVAFVRGTEFTNSIPPHIVESELDRLTMYAQQLKERVDRSLHVSAASQNVANVNYGNAEQRAGKLVGFDDQGQAALFEFEGGSIVGPPGPRYASRVEYDAPAVFRQAANGEWSHLSTNVTFIWTANGVELESRTIEIEIDPDTGEFIDPDVTEPGDDFTSTLVGTQLLELTSEYEDQREYASLSIVVIPADEYPTDTFTPAWGTGEFDTTDPDGDVSYALRAGVVSLFLTAALTAVSDSSAMTWDAGTLPEAIRPSAARSIDCVLQYDDDTEVRGQVTLGTDGSAVFRVHEVAATLVTLDGDFQTGEDKGLPIHWNVVYTI